MLYGESIYDFKEGDFVHLADDTVYQIRKIWTTGKVDMVTILAIGERDDTTYPNFISTKIERLTPVAHP